MASQRRPQIEIDFVDVLQEARLGPIQAGVSAPEVKTTLGEPDWVADTLAEKNSWWQYGTTAIAMQDDMVHDVFLYFRDDAFRLPERMKVVGRRLGPSMSLHDFLDYLRDHGIAYATFERGTNGEQVVLTTGRECKVYVHFTRDPDELDSIGFAYGYPACP